MQKICGNSGRLYAGGVGLKQDDEKASALYLLAAERGHPGAQYAIGRAFSTGRGLEQDYVAAHMWMNLSAASGTEEAVKDRDVYSKLMTPEQIAQAQKLAREWTNKQDSQPK